ncbi:unnamed protein product [Withania somnifera]
MAETQSPASQPLRRGPGHPGKQQSDEVPAVSPSPASPLGSTIESSLQVSVTRSSLNAVATTPLGSTSDRPLEVPSNEEYTKLNVNLSRILMHPSKTNYTLQQILDEELKKVTAQVKSLLVKKLLTSGNDVDSMVHQAKTAFRYLKGLGVDYGSFYRNIIKHIKHCSDLQVAEKEETASSLSALQKNYENAILNVNDVEEDLGRAQGEQEKAKEKKETLKRQIEDLKQEIAGIEHEEEHLKHDEIKYKEAHEVAKTNMQELGTQLEAAQAKLREIEQRKNAALQGIESTTRHLQSTILDNLD